MGQLVLENMEFYSYHGHYSEEQTIGGRFTVDLIIETDLTKAAVSDMLDDAIDYSKVYEVVKTEMAKPSRLLEHLALRIINAVYTVSERIASVKVTVSKLNPAIGGNMRKFSVVMAR
ncbi:MAG: dihydroneopterin aldolase [Bacteroidales bacterium]|nr:dihydroneopterin aldolase [Bacteroidales bacterium]